MTVDEFSEKLAAATLPHVPDLVPDFSRDEKGWDYLGELFDEVGTMIDLFRALSLMGDGIGGETGFAISQVADTALQTAENAMGCVEFMRHQREKGGADAS
ncbi:MAG TPA: hypothetical protein VGN98_17235 [Tianweitania sediminis]|jgi:flagellar biosynthesis protein FliR|nr:hypothetical protein [Tianweitania sediminis]